MSDPATLVNPFRKKRDSGVELTRRLKDWVRSHFRLAEEDAIMVSELECQVPGCPPIETVIAFWCEDGKRRHWKIFKPLAEVVLEDLPPWWMKNSAMIYDEAAGCDCC